MTNSERDAVVLATKVAAEKKTRISPNSKMQNYKATLPAVLPSDLLSIAVGNLLGDAYLQPNGTATQHQLLFEWGMNHEYALHIYNLYMLYCISEPRTQTRINANNSVITWPFQTVNHSSFNVLADLFLDGRKSIQIERLPEVFKQVLPTDIWTMVKDQLIGMEGSCTHKDLQ